MKKILILIKGFVLIVFSLMFIWYSYYRSINIEGLIDRIYIALFLLLSWYYGFKLISKKRYSYKLLGIIIVFFPFLIATYLLQLLKYGPTYKLNGIISILTYAYHYTGSTVELLIPVVFFFVTIFIILFKYIFKLNFLISIFFSFSLIYCVALYLITYVYYHLPLDYTFDDVINQKKIEHYSLNRSLQTSRKIYIDSNEQYLCSGFVSTSPYLTGEEKSGILIFDINKKEEINFLNLRITESFVFDEKIPNIYVAIDEGHMVLEIEKQNYKIKRYWQIHSADGLALLDNSHLLVRLESPLKNEPDFIIINIQEYRTKKSFHKKITCDSQIIARLNTRSIVIPELQRIALLTIGNDITELHIFDYDGNFIKMITLPDFCWEIFYSNIHQAYLISSVTSNRLYKVDPIKFTITHHKIPNGVREIKETKKGLIVLSDNLRGKVYMFNLLKDRIIHTFLVGRKPEGIAIGPKTGSLYVISEFGLSIFDLSDIQ